TESGMPRSIRADLSHTLEELAERLFDSRPHQFLSEHHRLPSSRGGSSHHLNLVSINRILHNDWHTITRNQTAQEIADQWSEWWSNGFIFADHAPRALICPYVVRGTFQDPALRGGLQTAKPS